MSHRDQPQATGTTVRRRTRQSLLAGLAGLLLSTAGLAEPVALERAPSGHLIVEVEIGATGPYVFLLDTGASHTAIAQPVAEALGFQSIWTDYNDVQSLTTLFPAERFVLQDLRFANLAPLSLNSVVIPVEGNQLRPVAGLLGADAIPATRYEIDFGRATLTLDSEAPQHADGMVNAQHLLLGQAEFSRGTHGVRVLIDSGSARTLVNDRLRTQVQHRARGVTYNIDGVASHLPDETGVAAQPILLRELELGGLCLNAVMALQADLDIFEALDWGRMPAMVIGMDVLQYATITVDREAGVFEISAAQPRDACRGERARALTPDREDTR